MCSDAVQPTVDRARPSISVIMPCYNAKRYLGLSLPPLIAMARSGEVDEVIVADDGSTDESASMAADAGARVIHTGKRSGPGAARNEAAKVAIGDVLWFVDADVVVHRGAASRVQQAFEKDDIVAIFGSYDDAPPAQNFASQYKNLIHHYYHQKGQREASTFWAGCGAVRRAAFLNAGGFDVARYPYPSIEDIELGHRLRARGGRIALDPQMLSTHLKVWSIGSVIHTDILRRAVPWARLMLSEGGIINDLNVRQAERLRAAWAGIVFLAGAAALAVLIPWWAPPAAFAIAVVANWDLFAFLRRRRGLLFALGGLLFHQLYYLYGTSAMVWCWIEAKLLRRRPGATR